MTDNDNLTAAEREKLLAEQRKKDNEELTRRWRLRKPKPRKLAVVPEDNMHIYIIHPLDIIDRLRNIRKKDEDSD